MTEPNKQDPGAEDLALRELFHGAVADLRPADDALDRLRHAVPRRRARKRQALVGAAAAVVLVGTGVPALIQLTDGPDGSRRATAVAGHGQDAGQTGDDPSDPNMARPGGKVKASKSPAKDKGDTGGTAGQTPPPAGQQPPPTGTTVGGGSAATGGTGGTGGSTDDGRPSGPMPPAAPPTTPACRADQLGAVAEARTPDADGKVYGKFRITNRSARDCVVNGAGAVSAAVASGPSASAPVPVVQHSADGPATGLPAYSSLPSLLLSPNSSYEVRFAWVPGADGCAAATPPAVPPAGAEDAQGADTGGSAASGATGVQITHTADPGAPTSRTVVPSACPGGTVYRTGIIPVGD
ncbi:hypothetical protein [Streptomyces sp. NPDC012888]|uniref:hypothetical protein n=1 Tax=Streptomyces sp. NPDC012888 TaxID=3364855 RepID=UPI0036BABE3F